MRRGVVVFILQKDLEEVTYYTQPKNQDLPNPSLESRALMLCCSKVRLGKAIRGPCVIT